MRMNFDNDAQGKGGNERAGRLLRFLALTLAFAGGALWVGGADTAGAHSDNCPSGQTAVVGTSVCVPAGEIEFADWCETVASSPGVLGRDEGRNVLTCETSGGCDTFVVASETAIIFGPRIRTCRNNDATRCVARQFYNGGSHACECIRGASGASCACPSGTSEVSGQNRCSCPAGQTAISKGGATTCYSDAHAAAKADCEAKGWTTSIGADTGLRAQRGLYCDIPVGRYDNSGQLVADGRCVIAPHPGEQGLTCESVFGSPLVFPRKTDHAGVVPVRNPDRDDPAPDAEIFQSYCLAGGDGGIPRTTNGGDTTFCGCDAEAGFTGDFPNCECPAGQSPSPGGRHCMSDAEAAAARLCRNSYNDATRKCSVSLVTGAGLVRSDGCFLGGTGTPQCANVFTDLNMPRANTDQGTYGNTEYVYNCGNGATPRTTSSPNALGRHPLTCSCDHSSGFFGRYDQGGCSCVPGRVLNDDGSACIPCPSGQAEDGGVCVEKCPGEEEMVDGICDVACPEGQRRVHSSDVPGVSGCVPLAAARALVECENAGWPARGVRNPGTLPQVGQLRCGALSDLFGDGLNRGTCLLYNNGNAIDDDARPCLKIYGDPPVYPRAEEHPDVLDPPPNSEATYFVSHCATDKDGGAIAGGWPAAENLGGVTSCGCDSENGYGGPWPNCEVCDYNETVDDNYGTCGTCPEGFLAEDWGCVDECSTGKLIQEGGCVDNCSLGYSEFEGNCYSGCPPGTEENDSGGCDLCATDGKVEDQGVCVDACSVDKAADGNNSCAVCEDGLAHNGLCVAACPGGTFDQGTYCGTCPTGQTAIQGRTNCVADADLEFWDWCYGQGAETHGGFFSPRCHISTSDQNDCAPFNYSNSGTRSGQPFVVCNNDNSATQCTGGQSYSTLLHACACPSPLLDDEGSCVSACPEGKRARGRVCVEGAVCAAGEFATADDDVCVPYNRLEFGNWCEGLDNASFQYSSGITFDWECELLRVTAEATSAKRTALCSPYEVDNSVANANLDGNAALRFWCHPDDGVTGCASGEGYLPTSHVCGACPAGTGAQEGLCVSECDAGTHRETRVLVNAGAQAAIDAIDGRRSAGTAAVQPLFDALIEAVRQWATRQGDDSNILAPLEGVAHNTDSTVFNLVFGVVTNNRSVFPNSRDCDSESGRDYAECIIGKLPRNAEGGAAQSGGVCVASCSSANPLVSDGVCVAECSGDNGLAEEGVCVSECSGERAASGGVCVSACPADSPWKENGVCVASCAEGNLEQIDKCVPLCETGYFLNLGVCEKECPEGQTAIRGRDVCLADSEAGFWSWCFGQGGEAEVNLRPPSQCRVFSSEVDTACNPHSRISTGTWSDGRPFVICQNNGASHCGEGQSYSPDVHSCVCDDEGRANLSGNCVAACPLPLLNERGVCVSECAIGGIEADNVCHHCPSHSPFLSEGSCVFECPDGEAAGADGVCASCEAQGKLLEGRACVESCASGSYESEGGCVEVCPLGTAIDGGRCVEGCGEGMVEEEGVCADECGEGRVVNEGVCADQCPADKGLQEGVCHADCPDGGVKELGLCVSGCSVGLVEVDSFCLSPEGVTERLRVEVQKASPDAVAVRNLISHGADVDASVSAIPILITAAALGHSVVVSILITAGADPAAAGNNQNVPFLMADSQAGLGREKRLGVLRHFGDAVNVRGTLFDWNARNSNNQHISAEMTRAANVPGWRPTLLEMTDYMLAQGMSCSHETTLAKRYQDYCTGTYGRALSDLVNQFDSVTLVSEADVLSAARAMVDAGISLEAAGDPEDGHPVARSAVGNQTRALRVLLSLGMDPDGQADNNRIALEYIVRKQHVPDNALAVTRAFIAGLEGSGRLTGANAYGGWNTVLPSTLNKKPLDAFHDNNDPLSASQETREETHALFYDYGARCASPGAKKYCQVPTETITLTARTAGRVLTVSRTPHGFRALSSGVSSSLTTHGWGTEVLTDVSPKEFVVSRTRNLQEGDAGAIFTLTMTSGASSDADSRYVMISLTAVFDAGYDALVSSVLEGDAAGTRSGLDLLGMDALDASTEGVPLLITAAVLGHGEVVSVLLTAGYDPDTRSDWFNLNIPLLMATYDGTRQPGGGELSRDKRLDVLRHFGDALEVRGTDYDWNVDENGAAIDGNGHNFADLLALSDGNSGANYGTEAERLEMADYALSRGATCNPPLVGRISSDRYRKYCVGALGGALFNALTASHVNSVTVLAAALAMAEMGISITLAGGVFQTSVTANVLGIAMHRLEGSEVGILISLGADPNSRAGGFAAPHIAARAAESNPLEALTMLQSGFIGGMLAAGNFSQFSAWNESVGGKTPMDLMQEAVTSQSNPAFKGGLHVQLYEQGSRCSTASGQYCELPQATTIRSTPAMGTGAVLTVRSRRFSGFRSPPVASDVLSSLTAHGWGVSQQASSMPGNSNPDMLLTRSRPGLESDAAAIFTVTVTSASGLASQAIYVSATTALESGAVSLAAAVTGGDAAATRLWLATLGAQALTAQTQDDPPVPLLIAAAVRGHGEVVSVLVTFGVDVNARHPDTAVHNGHNVPFLMADFGNDSALGLTRSRRLAVIEHFGGAIEVRGTTFAWGEADSSGNSIPDVLGVSDSLTSDAAERTVLLETADYFLARGVSCAGLSGAAARYADFCVGGKGLALVSLITHAAGNSPSDAAVRAAAQAMVDAGIPLEAAGDKTSGHLIPVAAFNQHASAVSILLTFGMNPEGRRGNDAAPHVVALQSGEHPAAMLAVLRAYVGGLSVAGRLASFDWNLQSISDTPLDLLDDVSAALENEPREKDEIHSLFYELGSRCQAGSVNDFCGIPTDDFALPTVEGAGAFFTLTARAFSDFQSPPIAGAVSATLEANGWGVALNTLTAPNELELNRLRLAALSDAPAVFTVTLASDAGASRELRVWATVSQEDIPSAYYDLITAVYEGNAEMARGALESDAELVDATDEEGVPLLIIAATLGHSGVLSVLVDAGFSPKARSGGKSAVDFLRDEFGNATSAMREVYYEIADYLLARGASCSGGVGARYDPPCIGSVGAALADLIAMTTAISDDDVRAAAQGVLDAGISLDFVGADGAGALVGLSAANGHSSAMSILLTFGMDPGGMGGGSGRTGWAALHHIAQGADYNATESLMLLQSFIGGLREAGRLGSFAGWNAESDSVGRPLDVFHEAATLNEDSLEEKEAMYELFYLRGAECADPGDKRYCGLPREEYSFLNVGATGPVVTLVGIGAGSEMFVLPGYARTVELYQAGWVLQLNADAVPPEVVLVRDAVGTFNEEAVAITLSLLSGGRTVREYRITARADFFFDCAAINKKEPPGGFGGCGSCLDDSTEIEGDCVRRDGDFRRSPHRTVCEDYLGGRVERNVVCLGVDEEGTFCVMGSLDVFPCRGFFRHVLRCNLTYNRVGLNPFACGMSCGDPTADRIARGARCE